MKTQKHTPGPWAVETNLNEYGSPLNVNKDAATTIASCDGDSGVGDSKEAEANARLIAAAPDLLAALRRAVPWLGKLIADNGHADSAAPNDAIGALRQAEDAIAKAEGN
jgi:hypothetical protein